MMLASKKDSKYPHAAKTGHMNTPAPRLLPNSIAAERQDDVVQFELPSPKTEKGTKKQERRNKKTKIRFNKSLAGNFSSANQELGSGTPVLHRINP
jgi:hypothetical protein